MHHNIPCKCRRDPSNASCVVQVLPAPVSHAGPRLLRQRTPAICLAAIPICPQISCNTEGEVQRPLQPEHPAMQRARWWFEAGPHKALGMHASTDWCAYRVSKMRRHKHRRRNRHTRTLPAVDNQTRKQRYMADKTAIPQASNVAVGSPCPMYTAWLPDQPRPRRVLLADALDVDILVRMA